MNFLVYQCTEKLHLKKKRKVTFTVHCSLLSVQWHHVFKNNVNTLV